MPASVRALLICALGLAVASAIYVVERHVGRPSETPWYLHTSNYVLGVFVGYAVAVLTLKGRRS
jgi:hypothetical protein